METKSEKKAKAKSEKKVEAKSQSNLAGTKSEAKGEANSEKKAEEPGETGHIDKVSRHFPSETLASNNKPFQNHAITDLCTYTQKAVSDCVNSNITEITLISDQYTAEELYWSSSQSPEKVQEQRTCTFPGGFDLRPYIPPPSNAIHIPGAPRSVFGDYIPIQ